ncbi:hypothetical protein [Paraburkholderia sp. MM6662-R1]|uniref:hypothetical protein n=1 Tax=Paraburkholderia sp. MM6662-R1 TaxID=2991066 RepID=UPI003D1F66E7
MNNGDYRRAHLRLAAERLIRGDRLARGRDVSHLTFARSVLAAEVAMHNVVLGIGRLTLSAHARHPLFDRRRVHAGSER